MNNENTPPKRVIAYIDGFNLYFGMKDSGWHQCYWLDVCHLAKLLLPPNTTLVGTKYFTARVISPEEKRKRQGTYLEALASTNCQITYGKYPKEMRHCFHCDGEYEAPQEKMTDVNIAVAMMEDAFQSRFDIALLISGDSDLTPPVAAVRRVFPERAVIVGFPPKRESSDLKREASASFIISKRKLQDSQLPDQITKTDGYTLTRPARWAR